MKNKLLLLLGAISYGVLSTIVTKAYGQGYSLGEVVGSQLLTGFVLIWLLVLIVKLREKRKGAQDSVKTAAQGTREALTWKKRLILLAAGAPTAVTGLLYYQSLHYIENSLAIVLLFQFTWMGVLIQSVVQRKRPQKIVMFTLLVLFVGTLLAAGVFERGMDGGYDWRGIVFGLLAAVSYSMFVLLSGKAVPAANPVYRSGWMITGGMLLVFILFPPAFLFDGTLFSGLLPYGFFLGLLGAFLPPLLFAIGVPHTGEGMAAILGASELPVAVMLSSVVLHEQVSLIQWFGVLLVLLGVALPELFKRWRSGTGNENKSSSRKTSEAGMAR